MKTALAILAIAFLSAALPAQAQTQEPTGLTLTITGSAAVPYMGSGAIPFTVSVGCLDLFQAAAGGGGTATVVVDAADAPAWFTATPAQVSPPVQGCDPSSGQSTVQGSLTFTVSDAAPAVVQHVVNLTATMGSVASDSASAVYTVAYNSKFSLTPSVTFPLTVTNATTRFAVTGVQASNAPSMIMVDDFSCDSGALISGIGALQYANKAGAPETKTYDVVFTAPKGEWTKATCSLEVYGHYNFDGIAGDPQGRQTLSWEFTNGGIEPSGGDGDAKDSPAPVFAFVAAGLLAFAGLRRRGA